MFTPLQQKLITIAEPIVEHWFTDVTEHDTKAVSDMEVGEYRFWCLRKTGTWMCVLSQAINECKEFNGIVTAILRRPEEWNDGYYHFFLVHKTSEDDGEIIPITYEQMQYVFNI